jgi:hypothetical protein
MTFDVFQQVLRATIKGILHQDLFFLEPSARQAFRYALPDDCLRQKLAQNSRPLGSHLKICEQEVSEMEALGMVAPVFYEI